MPQRIVAAYRTPDRAAAKTDLGQIIRGVPAAMIELTTLGRTLKSGAADVLAHFDRPGASIGPTETGGSRPRLHPRML